MNYYIQDGASELRFEIEGSVSGDAASELEQCWYTASSVIGNRPLVIVLGNVSSIDPFGRALILRWHKEGAQFVAKSPLAATLVSSIIGQPVVWAAGDTRLKNWARFRLYALPLILLIKLLFPVSVKQPTPIQPRRKRGGPPDTDADVSYRPVVAPARAGVSAEFHGRDNEFSKST